MSNKKSSAEYLKEYASWRDSGRFCYQFLHIEYVRPGQNKKNQSCYHKIMIPWKLIDLRYVMIIYKVRATQRHHCTVFLTPTSKAMNYLVKHKDSKRASSVLFVCDECMT